MDIKNKYNNKIYDAFTTFMNGHRTVDLNDNTHTHISMGVFRGCFTIPDIKLVDFYSLYNKVITKTDIIPGILERHKEIGPIILDLDLKHYGDDENSRKYVEDDIKMILNIYNKIILSHLEVNEDDMEVFVLEKKKPSIVKNDNDKIIVKDGVHIIYPHICTVPKVQFLFRKIIIRELKNSNLLNHLNLLNDLDDVFDICVIERNNWLLYGSCKEDKEDNLYKLSKIYNYELESIEFDEIDRKKDLAHELSIRSYFDVSQLNSFKPNITMEIINSRHDALLLEENQFRRERLSTTKEINDIKRLIMLLNSSRATDYKKWVDVGLCLHNIDNLLLEDWILFSKKAHNFKENECEKLWEKFHENENGLKIGTLHMWAREDNKDEYIEFMIENNPCKNYLEGSECMIAYLFKYFYKDIYKWVGDKQGWFEYNFMFHKWDEIHDGFPVSIMERLNTDIYSMYKKLAKHFTHKMNMETDSEKKKQLKKDIEEINKIAKKLHSIPFKHNICKELQTLYNDKNFVNILNDTPYNKKLIVFNNGVYDLEKNIFRNGDPEDYVSLSTKINYIPYDENNIKIKEVYKFLRSIQPNMEMYNYMIRWLSTMIDGYQYEQKFDMLTGPGANGKGRLMSLLIDAMGDYALAPNVSLITKPTSGSSNASPDRAATKGKRVLVFQEPEDDDKIFVGNMKSLVGGDKIQARELYKPVIEFYPQFKCILVCNKLPKIPSNDGGTWRRIRVCPFLIIFTPNPNPNNPNEKIMDSNINEQILTWKSAFMSILIHHYQLNINERIIDPEKYPSLVKTYTENYKNNSNSYREFFRDKMIKDNDSKVDYDSIWLNYKNWYKETMNNARICSKNDVKKEFEEILGLTQENYFVGYKLRSSVNNNDFD